MSFWKNTKAKKSQSKKKIEEKKSPYNLSWLAFEPEQRNVLNYVWYEDAFSPSECREIISSFKKTGNFKKASVGGVDNAKGSVELKIRDSEVLFVNRTEENNWIFDRFHHYLMAANKEFWNFDLTCFGDGLQFTKYEEGQYYKWHQDLGPWGNSNRKLSMVLNLSDPEEYKGGNLSFFAKLDDKVPRSQGSLIIFPSYEHHRVTPVKKGTRYSLVTWVQGPPFR